MRAYVSAALFAAASVTLAELTCEFEEFIVPEFLEGVQAGSSEENFCGLPEGAASGATCGPACAPTVVYDSIAPKNARNPMLYDFAGLAEVIEDLESTTSCAFRASTIIIKLAGSQYELTEQLVIDTNKIMARRGASGVYPTLKIVGANPNSASGTEITANTPTEDMILVTGSGMDVVLQGVKLKNDAARQLTSKARHVTLQNVELIGKEGAHMNVLGSYCTTNSAYCGKAFTPVAVLNNVKMLQDANGGGDGTSHGVQVINGAHAELNDVTIVGPGLGVSHSTFAVVVAYDGTAKATKVNVDGYKNVFHVKTNGRLEIDAKFAGDIKGTNFQDAFVVKESGKLLARACNKGIDMHCHSETGRYVLRAYYASQVTMEGLLQRGTCTTNVVEALEHAEVSLYYPDLNGVRDVDSVFSATTNAKIFVENPCGAADCKEVTKASYGYIRSTGDCQN